jgi:hypothetical protein
MISKPGRIPLGALFAALALTDCHPYGSIAAYAVASIVRAVSSTLRT